MQIKDILDERILSLCGTILNRQKLVRCERCDAVSGPAKYLDYIKKKIGSVSQAVAGHALCEKCARAKVAAFDSTKPPGDV